MNAKRVIIVYDHNNSKNETSKSSNDKKVYWIVNNNNIEVEVNNLKKQEDTEFCIVIHGDRVYEHVNENFKNEQKIHVFKYSTGGSGEKLFGFVKPLVQGLNNTSWEEAFDKLWNYCVKTEEEKKVNELIHLFLPLDIDMQALEIIQKDGEKVRKYLHANKDIEGMFQSRTGDEHYRQKLYDLWYLLGRKEYLEKIGKSASSKVENLTPIDNPSPSLQKLAGLINGDTEKSPIYEFLKSLDTGEKDGKEVTVEDLCKLFNLELEIKGKKETITSFHDWYCALAKCLRGEEACK